MLDVIHFIYEDDAIPMHEDHSRIKSNIRSSMWRILYEKEYPYPHTEDAQNIAGGARGQLGPDEDLLPGESTGPKPPTKPYIPPTDPEQFAGIGLDAPMGGDMR